MAQSSAPNLQTEWLLTNALGGFAMGTTSGVPTRRYHALLIAATRPPVGRVTLLSGVVESIGLAGGEQRVACSSFRFAGDPQELHPDALSHLKSFKQTENGCSWTYEIRELASSPLTLQKHLTLIDGENVAQLTYTLSRTEKNAGPAISLYLRPLTPLRDMHTLEHQGEVGLGEFVVLADKIVASGPQVRVQRKRYHAQLHLLASAGRFEHVEQWWNDFLYTIEQDRGYDCVEDVFSPGEFAIELPKDQASVSITIQAALGTCAMVDARASQTRKATRLSRRHEAAARQRHEPARALPASQEATLKALINAADDFIVARLSDDGSQTNQTSIIAGYPWFVDWGRDTCISLPGLLLTTGRSEEALKTLKAFASRRRRGIIPNVFSDQTGEPEYNTVDASLWFIMAACNYVRTTGDRSAWDSSLRAACFDIIEHYQRGTDFNIRMDPSDKLIAAGSPTTQLTWMDAQRDGVVFTPRHGKAVEINALWHSCLNECAHVDAGTPAGALKHPFTTLALQVRESFVRTFVDDSLGAFGLIDCLAPSAMHVNGWDGPHTREIRPNQIFAVSLPHSPLTIEQQKQVLDVVRVRLLTPMGLRTLQREHPSFCARYRGTMVERDRAYHNGTAWPWLLGPFAEATVRLGGWSEDAKREARETLQPILDQMMSHAHHADGCLGQVAEIYDADEPQHPQGCTAQAWSVAELLRAWLITV